MVEWYNSNNMYFYFNRDKYLISAKEHPYISSERIKQHNGVVREVEQLNKDGSKLQSMFEKHNAAVGLVIGLIPCIIIFIYLATGDAGFVGALFTTMFISIPILGVCYGISQNIPASSELKSIESVIKEKNEYLDNELYLFEELKKKQAQHWLGMSGHLFEKEVAKLFSSNGYEARVTKGSGDGGIDIFLEKNGIRYGVQCKNYHGTVGPAPIRELYGTMLHEELEVGIFIASSGYTKGARDFASNKQIQLLDINDVLRMHASTLA